MKDFVLEALKTRGGDCGRRLLNVGDEVALESAEKTLFVFARVRGVPRLLVVAEESAGVCVNIRAREHVYVRRGGDERVADEKEQKEARRGTRQREVFQLSYRSQAQIL